MMLQFGSFNSLEEVVDKEDKRTEHMRVVLARYFWTLK
jgi:hypothetical protein